MPGLISHGVFANDSVRLVVFSAMSLGKCFPIFRWLSSKFYYWTAPFRSWSNYYPSKQQESWKQRTTLLWYSANYTIAHESGS